MHPMLNTAIKAARKAGAIINRGAQDLNAVQVQRKTQNDFVTDVDRSAEQAIIDILGNTYPKHGFWGEESGKQGMDAEFVWIIDPLDGTTNFLHNFPQYAVSIALMEKNTITQAVVFDPHRNDLFTASKGSGAFLNDRRIRVSSRAKLEDSLISTGFPFRNFDHLDTYLAMFKDMLQKTSGIRRPGSAALDLAYTAVGWVDGFWEIGLSPWDIAAGSLLITEAGGVVSDFTDGDRWLETGNIAAGNVKTHPQILTVLEPHLTEALK